MKTTKERCPCYQCLCIAVCRLKGFMILTRQCNLVFDYLYMVNGARRIRFGRLVHVVFKILNPCWYVIKERGGSSAILHLRGVKIDK